MSNHELKIKSKVALWRKQKKKKIPELFLIFPWENFPPTLIIN